MNIEWVDVLKLIVPFVTGILMIWIKEWIETSISRNNKQHALSRLISDDINTLSVAVDTFKHIASSANHKNIHLVSMDLCNLASKFTYDLADLDSKHAYCYADFASSREIVDKGLLRLNSLILSRAGTSAQEIENQLDRAIIGQAQITAKDLISMCESGLIVMKAIPEKHRYSADAQAMHNLEQAINSAKTANTKWPEIPSKLQGITSETTSVAVP